MIDNYCKTRVKTQMSRIFTCLLLLLFVCIPSLFAHTMIHGKVDVDKRQERNKYELRFCRPLPELRV